MNDQDDDQPDFGDAPAGNPFAVGMPARQGAAQTGGSRALAARENTEVMAMVMSAKRFPRDLVRAGDRIINAFSRVGLAESSQYQFARGGSNISGPSIRAAEALAQQWGNMSSGWRELSRQMGPDNVGVSEVEAYCIDYENNSREAISFVVRHWRDTRSGGYALKEERDIYELCANQAQRRKRACILAQLPGDVVDNAMNQAALTLKASADTSPEAMARMVGAFASFGVTKEAIEKRIQRRLTAIEPAQVVTLKRIYASLRDGVAVAAEWFDQVASDDDPEEGKKGTKTSVEQMAARKAASRRKPPAAGADDPDPLPKATEAPPADPAIDAQVQAEEKKAAAATYAQLADNVQKAANADAAALILDAARDQLPADQLADLSAVWKRHWEGK